MLAYTTGMKEILALRNREIQVRLLDKVKLSEQKSTWQMINVGAPLFIIILGGLAFSFWRKKTYSLS